MGRVLGPGVGRVVDPGVGRVLARAATFIVCCFCSCRGRLQRHVHSVCLCMVQGFVSRGECFVQDESAGLVVAALGPQPGDHVLDCCAAPGGKTLFAAARMKGKVRCMHACMRHAHTASMCWQ